MACHKVSGFSLFRVIWERGLEGEFTFLCRTCGLLAYFVNDSIVLILCPFWAQLVVIWAFSEEEVKSMRREWKVFLH